MRIAILTLPFHANYGGIMQAYALQTVLKRLGHEVVVLDRDMFHHRTWIRQQVALGAFLFRRYILRRDVTYDNFWQLDKDKRAIEKEVRTFVEKHLNTIIVKDLQSEFPNDVDAVVVGSDQVWRPKYFNWAYNCNIDSAFLSFLLDNSIKKAAYAASFGTADWEYSQEETICCSRLIQAFDAVSVREYSALNLCEEKLGRKDVCRMPDPALLLAQEDYRSICNSYREVNRYLLYYVLDESDEIMSAAESIAKERGLIVKQIKGDADNPHLPLAERIKAPVEEWLGSVINADFVFTDSFHACVFSILFKIPFVVLGNSGRGMDRFTSLLKTYDLEKNFISSIHQYRPGMDCSVPSDVDVIVEQERRRAIAFLNKHLVS